MICGTCGFDFETTEIGSICPICSTIPPTTTETHFVAEFNNLPTILPVLKKGTLGRFVNKEHPWFNDIILICDRKHKFYRIEANGKKLWIPEHWIEALNE